MKKFKSVIASSLVAVLMLNLCACKSDKKTGMSDESIAAYMDILAEVDEVVNLPFGADMKDYVESHLGVCDVRMRDYSMSEPADAIHYSILDMNGDGIDELIITDYDYATYGEDANSYILEMYTLESTTSTEPIRVINGWDRSFYCWAADGRIAHWGYGGYAYCIVEIGEFDGTRINYNEFYYTAYVDDTQSEIGLYHAEGTDLDLWDGSHPGERLEGNEMNIFDYIPAEMQYDMTPFRDGLPQ